jgi:hypothetical protein
MKSRTFTSGKLTIKVSIKENKLGDSYKAMIYDGKKLLASIPFLSAPVYQSRLFASDSAISMANVARASISFAAALPERFDTDLLLSLAEEGSNHNFTIYYRNQKMVEI